MSKRHNVGGRKRFIVRPVASFTLADRLLDHGQRLRADESVGVCTIALQRSAQWAQATAPRRTERIK